MSVVPDVPTIPPADLERWRELASTFRQAREAGYWAEPDDEGSDGDIPDPQDVPTDEDESTEGLRLIHEAETAEELLHAVKVRNKERAEEKRQEEEARTKAESERQERRQKTEAESRQRKERQRMETFESERKARQEEIVALTAEIDELTPHWRGRETRAKLDAALAKRQQLAVEEEEAGRAAPFVHLSDSDLLSARSASEESLAGIEEQLATAKSPRQKTVLEAKRQQALADVAAHDGEARRRRMAHALAQDAANQAKRADIAKELGEIQREKAEVERTRRLDEAERKRTGILPSQIGKGVLTIGEINARAEGRQAQLDARAEALNAMDHQLKSAKDKDPGPLGHATVSDWVAGLFGPVQAGPFKGMPRVPTTDGEYVSPYEQRAKYGADRNRP